MKNEIVKAEDYGVKEDQAKDLTTGLISVKAERELLIEAYEDVITLEVTEENISTFKELRLKIRDNRTKGIEPWHKASKAFFLAGGKFCDAIKNKEILINTDMESKLMDAEKYFENLEKERINELTKERKDKLTALEVPEIEFPGQLGEMHESVWFNYVEGVKVTLAAKKEAEKKTEEERLNNERLDKIAQERYSSAILYKAFWNNTEYDFRDMCEDVYTSKIVNWKKAKKDHEAEQVRIKLENDNLKKEAEANEIKRVAAEQARKKKEKIAQDKIIADHKKAIEKRRLEAISFLFSCGFVNAHGGMEHVAYNHFIGSLHYSELESNKEYDSFCSEQLKSIEATKERIEKEQALKKLKELETEEQKNKQQEADRLQSELNKGDAAKIKDLINDLEALKTKYSFKSAKNQKKYTDVGLLIDKVVGHINT